MRKKLTVILISLSLIFQFICAAHAHHNQTTEKLLKKVAIDFVKNNISSSILSLKVDVLPFASYVKLPDCHSISVSFQDPQHILGRKTLSVSCQKPYWHIYMQVNIHGEVPVVIASKVILPGAILDQLNLKTKLYDTAQLNLPYFSSIKFLQHAKSKTYISKNHIIRPAMIEQQYLIPKGKTVMIISHDGSVYVKAAGVALEGGMKGGSIRVRNNTSKKIVYGTVVNPLEVSVF